VAARQGAVQDRAAGVAAAKRERQIAAEALGIFIKSLIMPSVP
jgi:hypothetical protein